MTNNTLLNPKDFGIDTDTCEDEELGMEACKKLVENWTLELETQMLKAFIERYYADLYRLSGPEDEEASKAYWPELETPEDLLKHTGKEVRIYALEDAIHGSCEKDETEYESQNVDVCVILVLNCPWNDHGWAAAFLDEKLVKVDVDIVDCVWID